VVVVPCDAVEARKATVAIATNDSPSYLRLSREKTSVITTDKTPFQIGKALVLREGSDVAIIACGIMVYEALRAAAQLAQDGINATVINNHTIKPLDEKTILTVAKKCGAVVTAEEHQIAGGMGSAISELLAKKLPTPVEFVGIDDHFGESGTPAELIQKFGLDATAIGDAVRRALARKSTT